MPRSSSILSRLALLLCAIAIVLSPTAAAPALRTDVPIRSVPVTPMQPCCADPPLARVWIDPYPRSVSRDVPMATVEGC